MSLSKYTKECIVRTAIEVSFKDREQAIKTEENSLCVELYNSIFDEKLRKSLSLIDAKWFRQDACLRFNCDGFDLRFNSANPLPVPYSTHCSSIGSVTGELSEKARDFAKRKELLRNTKDDARRSIMALLDSVRSHKRLKEVWAEGAQFYDKYFEQPEKSGVPSVQISKINNMLGINSEPKP